MKKKNNTWMYGIIGVCIAFASLMISFSIVASHMHMDLVVKDYYKEEINFQKQINKERNYASLAEKPVMQVDTIGRKMHIAFPGHTAGGDINGMLMFYRPDNQKYDDTVALHLNDAGLSDISLNTYKAGKWKVRMEWQQNNTGYLIEQTFNLK